MASQYQKLPSECCKRVTPTRANLGCLLTKVNFLVGVKLKTRLTTEKKERKTENTKFSIRKIWHSLFNSYCDAEKN